MGDSVADHEVGERQAFAVVSRASELVEYADNGTGNGLRSRYYVHGVSYVDERLMMYDDDTDRPYYYVTDRMHNVRVIVDRAGAIRERYAYDPYGRPLIRELCGRGDMNDDTRMTTTPDDSRFAAAKDGSIWDPRADLDDDGDVDGADETAYHNKKPTWSSVMSAPTVSQAFSDFDNPYAFQGVPHFALDTAANATAEQLNLALNHHRTIWVNVVQRSTLNRCPSQYNRTLATPIHQSQISSFPASRLRRSSVFYAAMQTSYDLRAPFLLGNQPTIASLYIASGDTIMLFYFDCTEATFIVPDSCCSGCEYQIASYAGDCVLRWLSDGSVVDLADLPPGSANRLHIEDVEIISGCIPSQKCRTGSQCGSCFRNNSYLERLDGGTLTIEDIDDCYCSPSVSG
jgi:hypothetical protein